MTPTPAIPPVTPLDPARGDLRLQIGDPPPRDPALQAAIDRRWHERTAANPRLYDGPILSVQRIEAHGPTPDTIICVRETFRSLCALPEVETHVRLLGVNGVIVGRDAHGREHVLLGRRGHETRVYDGMWELAPGGGVESPRAGAPVPGLAYLREALADEAREELGLEIDTSRAQAVGVARDEQGFSEIVSLRLELPAPIDPRWSLCHADGASDWEYIDAAWLARDDAPGFDRRNAPDIIPPTRAMLRFLGWIS